MNAREMQQDDAGTPLEVPVPVLFNTFKHHAGAVRQRIRHGMARGEPALLEYTQHSAVLGTKLMDFYTGALSPREIAEKALAHLRAEGKNDLEPYRAWVEGQGGYAVITFPEDSSNWVLRLGDESERYVHLHPGRWSPATVRVRANVIKTAFLTLLYAGIHGAEPLDRAVINHVRQEYLSLPPIGKDPEGELGLGALIELLRGGDLGERREG